MPILRPDSIFQEWSFTPEEKIQARLLTPLQIQWLTTKYAELTKAQAAKAIPLAAVDDRAYLMETVGRSAQLDFITELFTDHQQALIELQQRPANVQNSNITLDSGNATVEELQRRASAYVHNGNS
jgi:hypothetical protein